MEQVNHILVKYLWCTTNYHQDNWLDFLFIVEFYYNNTMHSTTQQTPLFANHGLHPMFDIQGVNNFVNHANEDWIAWLTNIQAQLVSNFKQVRRQYKENDEKHHKDQPNFKVKLSLVSKIKHQDNLGIKKIKLPKTWHVSHCETNQHNGIPTLCFIVGALPCFYHFKENT